ncbi:Hypothetical protein, putative [Bodo saltans]|uniref:Asteroid domain-containing protein n=1 Tax=Bodo saltans TaxID=75058 RepID=A0A0S4J1N1_BODSA|nr:Hypothetical protein, putative [Bodo saltans]|eukprot:CUG58722.1 Hypothetical protein, putative [Bodo saltans]
MHPFSKNCFSLYFSRFSNVRFTTKMGVKKLKTFLENNKEAVSDLLPIKDARNATHQALRIALVDGNGFLMTLQEEAFARAGVLPSSLLYPDADIIGGDLQPFRSALKYVVTRLRTLHNVELVVAIDAPQGLVPNAEREATWKDRFDKRRARREELEMYCSDTTIVRDAYDRERPSMFTTQTFATLTALGVQILQLDDEVDVHIGALVQSFKPICVITNDTDFVVTSTDIPTTLLQIDFPWDALFHGWDPRRHDGTSAKGKSPKALAFRVFRTSKLTSLLSNILYGVPSEFSMRHLWTAASLSGNDMTAKAVTKTSANGRTFTENILETSRRVKNADEGIVGAYGLDDAGLRMVEKSVERYKKSASRKQHFSVDEEARQVYKKMVWEQGLPASYYFARRDSKFVEDDCVPRVRDILIMSSHILGLESVEFSSFDTPEDVEVVAVLLRPEVERCIRRTWSLETPIDTRPHEEKLEALAIMFKMDPAVLRTPQSNESLLPSSLWLILWVLQPVCHESAYRHIVEMMVLVWLSEAQGLGSPAHKIIEGLACWQDSRTRRPILASVKLAGQFAAAYREVQNLLTLLSLDDSLRLPEPANIYSGSLLHYLFCFGDSFDAESVLCSLTVPLDDASLAAGVSAITTSIASFSLERFANVFA